MRDQTCARCRVIKYAKFVEAQHEREEAPGCEMCANNRVTLEKAWQVRLVAFTAMLCGRRLPRGTACMQSDRSGTFS